jgi:hypothetical protein
VSCLRQGGRFYRQSCRLWRLIGGLTVFVVWSFPRHEQKFKFVWSKTTTSFRRLNIFWWALIYNSNGDSTFFREPQRAEVGTFRANPFPVQATSGTGRQWWRNDGSRNLGLEHNEVLKGFMLAFLTRSCFSDNRDQIKSRRTGDPISRQDCQLPFHWQRQVRPGGKAPR